MAPGVRDLGDFCVSGRAGDIHVLFSPTEAKSYHKFISAPWYIFK